MARTTTRARVVAEKFGDDERVRLFTVSNAGKAAALNTVCDTREARSSSRSMRTRCLHRKQSAHSPTGFTTKIGRDRGNAKVGNRVNLVTRWQALEYITSQNMDRRAFASLNCITVVPGAVGAWRKDLLVRGWWVSV